MNQSQGSDAEVVSGTEVISGTRRYRSPNRILARSFRLARDAWKEKHHQVQAKLEQERQLSAERGQSRDRWREKCELATTRAEAAELLAQQQLTELEQAREHIALIEAELSKKK